MRTIRLQHKVLTGLAQRTGPCKAATPREIPPSGPRTTQHKKWKLSNCSLPTHSNRHRHNRQALCGHSHTDRHRHTTCKPSHSMRQTEPAPWEKEGASLTNTSKKTTHHRQGSARRPAHFVTDHHQMPQRGHPLSPTKQQQP
jgi:hypothetical protein